jgi:NADH-quinone oxidoreductase subunit L
VVLPLTLLAAAALGIGWLETPSFLGGVTLLSRSLAPAVGVTTEHEAGSAFVPIAGLCAPAIGLIIAYALFRGGFWHAQAARPASRLATFMRGGFGFDTVYDRVLVRPFHVLSEALKDDPVDLLFAGLARLAVLGHDQLRLTQVGQIRRYARWLAFGSIATVALVVYG